VVEGGGVLGCGLDYFEFLISLGFMQCFLAFQNKQKLAPPLNTLHHEPVQTGNPLVLFKDVDLHYLRMVLFTKV
jgi:hypothetical protein